MVSERTVADLKAKLAERDRKIDALNAETTTLRRCIGETPCKCVFKDGGELFSECDRCTILRIAGKSTINGADVLAERDRRIAELEGAIRTFLYDGNIREGAITANGCTCKYALESVEALDAALSGKGVSR